jgi:glycosyltransferase involved in cell wall biosynthesis
MRVLQVVDILEYGGAQKLLVTFAQQAQKQGILTTVICLYERRGTPVRPELEAYGAKVIVLKSRRLFDFKVLQKMYQIMQAEKFDIVHTHLTYANITGALTGWFAETPVIATLHNTFVDMRHSHPLRDRLEYWIMRNLNKRVLAVGENVADAYKRILHRDLDVIPNAVSVPAMLSIEERVALRKEIIGDVDLLLCIAVGRFSPQKGYLDLITAFDIVHKDNPTAVLVIVGDGVLRPEIEARISELSSANYVKLLGLRNDVPRLLMASDLYVNASLWEGLPIAHLEAMAAGVPMVVTAVGDVPRIVVEGMGLMVAAQNPGDLARAISALLRDLPRRSLMGASARQFVTQNYSAPVWFDKIIKLYHQAGAN